MKFMLFSLMLVFFAFDCFGQKSSNEMHDEKKQNNFVFAFIPAKANNIYGIAFGLIGSESICNKPYTKYSYGLNIQILGQGFLQTFYVFNPQFKRTYSVNDFENEMIKIDTSLKRVVHNGLIISPFGTFSDQINGVSMSSWMSAGKIINGISFNLLWNLYYKINGLSIGGVNTTLKLKGVQIGLVNKTIELKGIQIGLWNKNKKRSLPIVNWNFRD